MSEPCLEQRPLLCDDCSDEELQIKNYKQRRNRLLFARGRARNHAKGAAAVIARWPDHCFTSVIFWWFGAMMIAIAVFIIYNCVFIFGVVSKPNLRPQEYRTFNNVIKPKAQSPFLPDVFIHLIINNDTTAHLNKHLPYIETLSHKYPSFKYVFFIFKNDTLNDDNDFSDDQRNKIALNNLWTNKSLKKSRHKDSISVEYISLTAFLNDSPIKKFWRNLSPQVLEFLVRAVSIWEKGGIAFNPMILTSEFHDEKYIEKLYYLLQKYMDNKNELITKTTTEVYSRNKKTRPNNIRDIINALDQEDSNISQFDLNVADTNIVAETKYTSPKTRVGSTNNRLYRQTAHSNEINNENIMKEGELNHIKNLNYTSYNLNSMNDTGYIIPLFFKYLFHHEHKQEITNNNTSNEHTEVNDNNAVLDVLHLKRKETMNESLKVNISEQLNYFITSKPYRYSNDPELSIDIKGNIIASKTPCHAFLGTMFSNVINFTEEKTVTDFIISELSLFCNGLLMSCAGINVIVV